MRKGIASLLKDYYHLEARSLGGDFDTTVMLADLMDDINSDKLTIRQRQFIALYYFCGLTFPEIAHVMGIASQTNVSDGVYAALERLGTRGNVVYKSRTPDDFSAYKGAIYRWLDAIAEGAPVGEPKRSVVISIARILKGVDEESAEMIRQHQEGTVYLPADEGEEYVHLSDSQIRWRDRRVTVVDEVLPVGDVVGSRRYTPAPDYEGNAESEDVDYSMSRAVRTTGRRKMFKLRGN